MSRHDKRCGKCGMRRATSVDLGAERLEDEATFSVFGRVGVLRCNTCTNPTSSISLGFFPREDVQAS